MKVGSSNLIEPGDCGVFDLIIDATGSDVSLIYNMELNISGMPKNLILYADEQMQHKIPVIDNSSNSVTDRKIKIEDFIGINDNSQTQTKRIYWQWPFESGTSDVEIASNDIYDSRYMGRSVEMQINVIAKQTDDEPIYLAKKVNVGDLVNYSANISDENGNTFAMPYSYTTDSEKTGAPIISTFSSSDSMTWKVLYKNEDFGIVELISANGTPNSLALEGRSGFTNAIALLEKISTVYGHGYGSVGARSATTNDIDQYSSYDKTTYEEVASDSYYGKEREYTGGGSYYFKQIEDKNGNIIGYETTVSTASTSNKIKMTHTYYQYTASDYYSNPKAYNMLFENTSGENRTYWLARRCAFTYVDFCNYCLDGVLNGKLVSANLCRSTEVQNLYTWAVSPVIILDTTLKTNPSKNENQEWELKF